YLSLSISSLIERNIIRADLPDPQSEPVLYDLVCTYQVHWCRPDKCNSPPLPGEQCNKKFPASLSAYTYLDPSSLRHCNFQYV
ncbi:18974_t:CDS:2, partial [Racocetra fulgida]